ncbi:hypothetical protein, partial [Kitasatospora sp. NPDC056184]|uniref:hypothetical protein n=1 Tax=Kitasatospora sp. NPDC056184 TaxID=3345738 RepID=UPI0035DD1DB0
PGPGRARELVPGGAHDHPAQGQMLPRPGPTAPGAARAVIGDPTSGLSRATGRRLQRHTAAHARAEELLLPHLRAATADLAHHTGRLRPPDTPEGRRPRTALAAYESAWNTTGSSIVTEPQDVSSRAHP